MGYVPGDSEYRQNSDSTSGAGIWSAIMLPIRRAEPGSSEPAVSSVSIASRNAVKLAIRVCRVAAAQAQALAPVMVTCTETLAWVYGALPAPDQLMLKSALAVAGAGRSVDEPV